MPGGAANADGLADAVSSSSDDDDYSLPDLFGGGDQESDEEYFALEVLLGKRPEGLDGGGAAVQAGDSGRGSRPGADHGVLKLKVHPTKVQLWWVPNIQRIHLIVAASDASFAFHRCIVAHSDALRW